MGLLARIRAAFSPAKLTSTESIAGRRPLWDQYQRIGGGLTPLEVTDIIRAADHGQPTKLIDLANESRNKDGHLQSVLGTREQAVALTDVRFVEPDSATAKERKAVDLCKRIYEEFENWETLVEHLTSSFFQGHATAEITWKKRSDGAILPTVATPILPRYFIFEQSTGALHYAVNVGDITGVDLLEENPGRIVQLQRRIIGGAPSQEGMIRLLVWAALLRNWGLRDWLELGEIGWKPWRIGKYPPGTHESDIIKLREMLELIGSRGVGVVGKDIDVNVEWPKGQTQNSSHQQLFDALGREMSKAVLGQTTTIEASPNGDRAATQTRDLVRLDIRERDARAVASALRAHMFAPAVALNLGSNVRVPVPWFQTDEATDMVAFSTAVKNLAEAKVRISAKWVRDEIGAPEPEDDEEVIGGPAEPEPDDAPEDDLENQDPEETDEDEDEDEESEGDPDEKSLHRSPSNADPGQEYTDRVQRHLRRIGANQLAGTLAGAISTIRNGGGYDDVRQVIERFYGAVAAPRELATLTEAAITLGQLGGHKQINDEPSE